MGVVTADVSLEGLLEMISRLLPERMGFAFLISRNGVFLSHPNKAYPMQESIFSIAEANADGELRRVGRQMIEGGEGCVPVDKSFTGQRSWMYYAPLPSVGWSIGLVFPESTLFAEISLLTRNVIAIGAAGFLLLFVAIIVISGAITRPLRQLAARAGELARGNLEIDVPAATSKDEVGELSRSFREMKDALKEYINDLAETTAAKERIESELKIAHTIQMSFLPKTFPPFPEKDAFEIFATLEPAKEVGGDLYDFFLLDDDHLFFSIGDVSGKGVPAALFMAVTKTLVKGIAKHDMTPAQTLRSVNAELVIDNDSSMFVTLFCAVVNFRTGELAYCSAGHNPPVLLPAGEGPRWLEVPPDFLLGVMEDVSYRTTTTILAPGDVLLLYTDGVTEAMNEDKAFFTEGALLGLVKGLEDRSPRTLVTQLLQEVKAFAGNEPQSDDITLLALRFKGGQNESHDHDPYLQFGAGQQTPDGVALPDPVPQAGEIQIRVSACGVCHTELDEIEGRTAPPALPVIPGHQVVGTVVGAGPGPPVFPSATGSASVGSSGPVASARGADRGGKISVPPFRRPVATVTAAMRTI
jgi:sigma-B regulation protein RsbU (phosphoserine phosphatase)